MKAQIVLFIFLLSFLAGCKKEASAPRHIDYAFVTQLNSGITGKVSFIEADSAQTTVDVELNNTPDPRYVAHIHMGSPPHDYHGAIYFFDPIYSSGGKISYKKNIPLLYDSALTLNGTFAFHDSLGDIVLGYCGVGINKDK